MSTPTPTPTPAFTDDQAANRRIWSEWLRRPDWQRVPRADGRIEECRTPWDVGYALAGEHWPSSRAIVERGSLYPIDVEDEIMYGCYGIGPDGGEFIAAELPERIRNIVHMAAQAALSAPPCDYIDTQDSKELMEDLPDTPEWTLYVLSVAPIDLWEYDPSPMRGAILSPTDVARLIADILDAAPPSMLMPPEPEEE